MKPKTAQTPTIKVFSILLTVFLFCAAANGASSPEIIPHRGGKTERPENTLQAFKECVALGAKTLELDVQVTKDGMAVVYHPADLSAHTDGKGEIKEFSYADLQQFDAAYKFQQNGTFPERGKGHKIPLFEDVLKAFPDTKIIVDLKSLPAAAVVDAVAEAAEKQKAWSRLVFYSTDDGHLHYLKEKYPQAVSFESRKNTVEELLNAGGSPNLSKTEKTVWLGFELVRQFKLQEKLALGDAEYPINLVVWTEPGLKRVRQKLPKIQIVMFGINTPEDYQQAARLGANAIYTDAPALLLKSGKTGELK